VIKRLSYLFLGLSLFLLGGCSVKEDRIDCPCFLKICFQKDVKSAVTLTVKGEKKSYFERINVLPSDYPNGYTLEVPKDRYDISCINGQALCNLDSSIVIIPTGKNFDRLYGWSDLKVDCLGESTVDTVKLHKQYCKLTITLIHADTLKTYPYSMNIRGSYVGMGIYSLKPVKGVFKCSPEEPSEFVRSIVFSRQDKGDLVIDFTEKLTGKTYSYDLSSLFNEHGYDWNAEDLKDVDITLDFATPRIGIKVNDWIEIYLSYEI
jgi:hypothetical protein